MMPKVKRKVATGRLMKGAESDMAQRLAGATEPSPPPQLSPIKGEGEVRKVPDTSPPPLLPTWFRHACRGSGDQRSPREWGRVRGGGAAAARPVSPPPPPPAASSRR